MEDKNIVGRLCNVESDIITIYKVLDRQSEDLREIYKIGKSIELLAKDMEYLRDDTKCIKKDNENLNRELREHQETSTSSKLSTLEGYKKNAISTIITIGISGILGAVLALIFK